MGFGCSLALGSIEVPECYLGLQKVVFVVAVIYFKGALWPEVSWELGIEKKNLCFLETACFFANLT